MRKRGVTEHHSFPSPRKLAAWFARHGKSRELVILFHKRASGKPSATYAEALDEALAAGWIDGVRKRVDDETYTIRFTPRAKGSKWSSVNIRKAQALIEAGRMTPRGLAAFEERSASESTRTTYDARPEDLPPDMLARLNKDARAASFWAEQPPGYRKNAAWYILSAKRPDTRARRLLELIDLCRQGRRLSPGFGEPRRERQGRAGPRGGR